MKKVLVLGGTRFFGKVLVEHLIAEGNQVTIATRGRTKDEFASQVQRLIVDREDKISLEKALQGKVFDVVYDNICYSPNAVRDLLNVLRNSTKKYIITSSLATYKRAKNIKEEAFDPYNYPIRNGETKDFSYAEGKKLAEAVAYQEFNIPTIAARFPVVIGENDYTKRLEFFVEHILDQTPIYIGNPKGEMCFITEEEAGGFLAWLGDLEIEGPINASCDKSITIEKLIGLVEIKLGKKAICVPGKDAGVQDPYSVYSDSLLDSTKAKELGFKFKNVEEEIERLVQYYIEQRVS